MRMMTGAILILAGSFLLGICETLPDEQWWIPAYSYVLTILGVIFLSWGTFRDLSIYARRKRRQREE